MACVAIIEQSASMFWRNSASTLAVFQRKTLVHDAEREGDFSVAMQRKAAVVNLRDKNFHNLADLDNAYD